MKVKTISVSYSDGTICNTDGFELRFEYLGHISGSKILMINSCDLSELIQYLYSKGISTPPLIPLQIHAENITLVLDKSIEGYIIL